MLQHYRKNYTILSQEPAEGACSHTRRMFLLIGEKDVNRNVSSSKFKTLPGTRMLHSIRPVKPNVLETRKLSCFCSACLDGTEDGCDSSNYAKPWETVKLMPNRVKFKRVKPNESSSKPKKASIANTVSLSSNWHDVFVAMPVLGRSDFFPIMQDRLSKCNSFADLKKGCNYFKASLDLYPSPSIEPRSLFDVVSVDPAALDFVPQDLMGKLFTVKTKPDENCIPRTFSLLLFGHQESHVEVRCRIVCELVTNVDYFLVSGVGTSKLELLCQLSDFYGPGPRKVFESETLEVSKMHVFMGMWQLMAAANAF